MKKDPSSCNKINDEKLRAQCMGHVISPVNNTCDLNCMDKKILNNALINQNSTLCEDINDKLIKAQCQGVLVN